MTLSVPDGATFGIVGESGSGKTTLARMLLLLETPTSGTITFAGRKVEAAGSRAAKLWYRRSVQAVFQDIGGSLDPRMMVEAIVAEPMLFAGRDRFATPLARRHRTEEVLGAVGLPPDAMWRYAHQLSGGQRQRVALARALAVEPRLIVLDEPVSALDMSVRNQVLNLLARIQKKTGVTYVMIAHDLALVGQVTDETAVMYLGTIVETGPTRLVLGAPLHPYTEGLKRASPSVRDRKTVRPPALVGEIPSPLSPPPGCRFHTRCPLVADLCRRVVPTLKAAPDGRLAACHVRNP